MGKNQIALDILGKLKLDAEAAKKSLDQVQSEASKIQLGAKDKGSFDKIFKQAEEDYKHFQSLISKGGSEPKDLKVILSAAEKMRETFAKLGVEVHDLTGKEGDTLKKLIPKDIADNIDKAEKKLKAVNENLEQQRKLEENVSKATQKKTDAEKSYQKVLDQTKKFEKVRSDKNEAKKKYGEYFNVKGNNEGQLKQTEQYKELTNQAKEAEEAIQRATQAFEEAHRTKSGGQDKRFKLENDQGYKDAVAKKNTSDANLQKFIEDAEKAKVAYENALATFNQTPKPTGLAALSRAVEDNTNKVELAQQALDEFTQSGKTTAGIEALKASLQNLGVDTTDCGDNVGLLTQKLEQFKSEAQSNVIAAIKAIGQAEKQTGEASGRMAEDINKGTTAIEQMDAAAADAKAFQSRLTQFFSLTNGVQLLKRAVNSAYDTIKDLDAVMTETAVVTDFSVGDMWDQLPEYTKRANELGISIHSAYEAATLYYQQGLSTNEVMAVSNETLKMARIAGLEAADATDRMTNAMRGFNMAITEANAQNVNDVYSNLAAKTASNVDEISTAMTKVASLANNANMSFENTAAFLSQIIETTRESAETAGTALKTVIARFSEVKELRSKGELTGTDEEGQEIDVNKVSKALRSAGIDLNEYFTGAKGLDEIFLELAKRWSSLDQVQQRYIATMAAGSRQQSRFIALMSDYARTQELVGYATNADGASQEQFEKTLESLESKLNQLKNAWDEFTMGITQSGLVKGTVELLTNLLQIVNRLTDAFGETGSAVAKLLTAFTVFKVGKAFIGKEGLVQKIVGNYNDFYKAGVKSSSSFSDGFKNGLNGTIGGIKGSVSNLKTILANGTKGLGEGQTISLASFIDTNSFAVIPDSMIADFKKQFIQKFNKGESLGGQVFDNILKTNDGNFVESIKQLDNALAKSAKGFEKHGQEVSESNKQLEISGTTAAVVGNQFRSMAGVVGTVAGAFGLLSGALKSMGFEEAGDAVGTFATGLMVLAAILPIIPPLCKAIGVSIETIPIIGWVVAIIDVLITLGAVIHNFIKSSDKKSQKLANSLKQVSKEAEAAQQAYSELLDKQKQYDDAISALDDLTVGTKEWKQALLEANNIVLELLSNYPELAQFLTRDENGAPVIAEEGFELLIDKAQQKVNNAQYSIAGRNLRNNSNQKKEYKTAVYDTAFDYAHDTNENRRVNDTVNYLKKDKTQEFLDLKLNAEDFTVTYDQNNNPVYTQKLIEAADDLGASIDVLAATQDDYIEYQKKSLEYDLQNDTYKKNILYTGASSEVLKSQYQKQIIDIYSNAMGDEDDAAAEIESIASDIYKNNGNSEFNNNEFFKELVTKYSDSSKYTGNDKEDLKTLYADMKGISVSDVKEDNKKELSKMIAEIVYGQQSAEKMNEYYNEKIAGKSDLEQRQNLTLNTNSNSVLLSKEEFDKLSADGKASDEFKEAYKNAQGSNLFSHDPLADFSAEDKYDELQKQFAETQNRLISMGVSKDLTNTVNLDALKSIAEKAEELGGETGEAYANAMLEVLNDPNLGEQEKKQLEMYLTSIDLSSMSNVLDSYEELLALNVDSDTIQKFWDVAIAAAQPYVKTLEEALQLTDKLHQQMNSANDLEEKLKNGTATTQEILELKDKGFDTEGKLTRTADGWQMSESDSKEAAQIYKENVAKEAQLAAELNKKSVEEVIKNPDNYGLTLTKDKNGEVVSAKAVDVTKDNYETYADQYDLKREDDESKEDFIVRIQAKLDEEAEGITNRQVNQQILDQEAAYQQAIIRSSAENEAMGNSSQSIIWSAENEATEAGIDLETIRAYREELEKVNGLSEENAAQIATYNAKMNTGLGEIIDSYDEWTGLIDKSTGKIKVSSAEEAKIYEDLKKSANKMLNTSEDLSDAFWDNAENIKNMKEAAEGDTEALEKLQKAASYDYLANNIARTEEAKNALQEFENTMNNIDIPQLKAGVEWNDEGAQKAIQSFNDMARASNLSAEQIQESVKAMGFDAEIEYKEETREVPGESTTRVIDERDPVTNEPIRWHTQVTPTQPTPITGWFPVVKTLTSSGAGGGGVSIKNKKAAAGNKGKSSGGKGGGGKPEKKKDWKNPYDKLYNLTEKINENLRQREKLETVYNRLLKDRKVSGEDLLKQSQKEIENLEKQAELQRQMLKGRKSQIDSIGQETWTDDDGNKHTFSSLGVTQYANYNAGTGTIEIDWDAINQVKDENKGSAIEAYISKLEELVGKYEDTEDALFEIEDQIEEIKQRGIDEAISLEDRVVNAIVDSRQKQIDELQSLSDTIDESNQKVLEGLREQIELERQIRDNTKTEEDITDKENRLAYLQRDTSGANDLEILQLQKELDEARENYTDTLIDQAITQMEKDNQLAAEQRAEQISIMSQQLAQDETNGVITAQAMQYIANAYTDDGTVKIDSELVTTLKNAENFGNLTDLGKEQWMKDLVTQFNTAYEGFKNGYIDIAKNEKNGVSALDRNGKSVTATWDSSKGQWKVGNKYYGASALSWDVNDRVYRLDADTTTQATSNNSGSTGAAQPPRYDNKTKYGVALAIINGGYGWGNGKTRTNNLQRKGFNPTEIQGIVNHLLAEGKVKNGKWVGAYYGIRDLKPYALSRFAKGGLADFTGPAWLDGTKSKPEMVLNPKDTENFIQLKNILANVMSGVTGNTNGKGGDNYFDIKIEVAEIANDYDVDQLADRLKKQIYDDASYRNVNFINYLK